MKRSHQDPRSFYKVGRIRYAATIAAIVLSIGSVAVQTAMADSPAARDQAVIAQGVTTIPDSGIAWSVNLQTASSEAETGAAATGFLVGDQGSLLVEDADGDRTVLDGRDAEDGAAEALFVNGDGELNRTALGDEAQYYEIALVSGADTTGETVIGNAFDLPAGDRELSLIQGDLNGGSKVSFETSEFPILLVSTAGDLRVEQTDGVNGVLSAHEAVLLAPGERATVEGEEGRAAYVAVVIGDEIGTAGPSPTATQEPAAPPAPTQPPAEPTAMPTTSPAADDDQDGLSNDDEALRGTDPKVADTDFDGLEDGYEVFNSGTLPLVFDTDGDGLPDGDEIFTFSTNPSNTDTDGDGLSDYQEAIDYGTNASVADTDGDGLSDGSELTVTFTDPSSADTDGDGVTDSSEINAGTNPNDPASK